MKKRLVLFASGSGSNADNVSEYFSNHALVEVVALFCNNPKAGVIEKMNARQIPVIVFNRETFKNEGEFLSKLDEFKPDLIALLGFLWKVPNYMVEHFPNKIINLHPALLPKFGGKGMFGHHVHEAVKEAGEKETGITLHWVNSHYDEGETIAQFTCDLSETDTIETISAKIHLLEQKHVPVVVESILVQN